MFLESTIDAGSDGPSIDVIALDEALKRLERMNARLSRVVELRYFCGLNEDEVASVLDVSTRTVRRDWTLAKAWLYGELASPNRQAP